jgi:hypothetical protein
MQCKLKHEITVDNLTENQYLMFDELTSDGFTDCEALIYIEGMENE